MEESYIRALTMICLSMMIFTVSSSMAFPSSRHAAVVKGAYWPSWFSSSFPPSSIDTSFFTHIYYAFLSPNNATFQFDIPSSTAPILLDFASTLRRKTPPVKSLFSIGGGDAGASLFSRMASNPSSRKTFILSTIEVARKYGFDGIDLDWEFPQNKQDMDNLGLLLDEWRAEVRTEARATRRHPLLLTAAVYFAVEFFLSDTPRSFPVESITRNLDWINAMCYDYAGSWDTSATGAHAALYNPRSNVSTSYGLGSWLRAGLPREKLVMGLPLYGKTWTLKDPEINGVGAPAVGVGPGDVGILFYRRVEEFNEKNNATVVYDETTVSAYSVAATSWVGYDDLRSTAVKVRYARALGIRGHFFWALSYDSQWKISRQASRIWR